MHPYFCRRKMYAEWKKENSIGKIRVRQSENERVGNLFFANKIFRFINFRDSTVYRWRKNGRFYPNSLAHVTRESKCH